MSTAFIHKMYISPGHDFKGRHGQERLNNEIIDSETIECKAGQGIVGDRYFNFREDFKGQITFFDWTVFQNLKTQFDQPELDPFAVRRNVFIEGIGLNELVGQEFVIGDIRFSGSEECAPCYWMDQAIAPGAETFLKGTGGLRARILSDGKLSCGPVEFV